MGSDERPAIPENDLRRRIFVCRRAHGVSVVAVECEIDLYNAPWLGDLLARELRTHARGVVVDLSACTFIDSSGLAAFTDAPKAASVVGTPIVVAGSTGIVARAFALTRLDDLFVRYETVDDALRALRQSDRAE